MQILVSLTPQNKGVMQIKLLITPPDITPAIKESAFYDAA